MLIEHLNLISCPVCQLSKTWTVDGAIHENRVINGTVKCQNDHKWNVSQEILRFNKEDSSEAIIYSDVEKTGYPTQVTELERSNFLDFIGPYFKALEFNTQYILVSGEPILFFRYLEDRSKNYISTYNDEGILRQLHEMAVRRRIYEKHSFIRSKNRITAESTNQLITFPKMKFKKLPENSMVLQFIPISEETKGKIIWTGEKYKLEELTNLS